ncbi:efflux RND transporter periplasmic adaptor subunit [Ponticaulis profundi]|uniref:Efflux RND transporter periplasmic adaptor subunit n=1 Tax=Ponticaulis profundi TaxID=2665222 RepID=A0ABW1S9W5_9PROT
MKHLQLSALACLAALLSACGSESGQPDSTTTQAEQASEPKTTVRVVETETRDVQTFVFGEGTARAVKREFLTFESAGRVDYIDPDIKEGDPVKKGQLIAYQQQDRPEAELANAQANVVESQSQRAIAEARLEEAEASLELAENTYERFRVLLEKTSASPQEVEEARVQLEQARAAKVQAERQLAGTSAQIAAAKAQYDSANVGVEESRITSPIDGVLARLNIEQGQYFSPQQVQSTNEASALQTIPVVIVDTSTLEITVNLPSYTYSSVEVGRPVLIVPEQEGLSVSTSAPANAPETYQVRGVVYSKSPSVDPETRTFSLKVRTVQGAERLQDGAFVTTWILGPNAENAVAVPLTALRFENNEPFVFVLGPDGSHVERRAVTLGLRGRQFQEVTEGLTAGEQIVTDGKSSLSDGSAVRILAADTASSGE